MKNARGLAAATVVSVSFAFSSVAAQAKSVQIPSVIPFAADVEVTDAVRAECQLGEKVSSFIKKYGKGGIEVVEKPAGKYLDMEITHVFAPGGGAWSGPKWLEVSGTLKEGGKDVASFRAKRFSGGGPFGGMKGTCAILGRTTKAIGKDISNWLKGPVDGAALGDAKNG